MPLIATLADTCEQVESFSASPETWAAWRKLGVGYFLVGHERVPAVLKRSSRGLQFFTSAPGYMGKAAPESIEHQLTKIALVQGLRAAGYKASVERPGRTPSGEEWVADVFVEAHGRLIAFEVQLSRQHWDVYRMRTERYTASGVKCVWLVKSSHYSAFADAKARHLMAGGMSFHLASNEGLPDMPAFSLDIGKVTADGALHMQVVVCTAQRDEPVLRLDPGIFATGAADGRVYMRKHGIGGMAWRWRIDDPGDLDGPLQLSLDMCMEKPKELGVDL